MTNTKLHTENNAWMNTKGISKYTANYLHNDKKTPCKSIQWQQLRKQRKWCYHIHFFGHPGLSSNSSPFFFTFYITGYLCIYQRGYLLAANLKTFSFLFKQSVKSLLMVHVIIDIPCSTGQFCGICFCFSWGEEIIFLP